MFALRCLLASTLTIGLSTIAWGQATRLPVPPESEVQATTKLIADVYKQDYEAAKTSAQRRSLARKMLTDAGKTTGDPGGVYALCSVARKVAVGIGDVDTAMQATRLVTQQYNVDAAATRYDVLKEVAPSTKTRNGNLAFVRYAGQILPDLVQANDFTRGLELLDLTLTAARECKDADLVKTWLWRKEQTTSQAKAYAHVSVAHRTLANSPVDAAANGVVGKYACFWQEDWPRGITMLALSDEQPWQKLAERELKGPTSAADQLALADSWYDAGQQSDSPAKEAVLRHAARQYEQIRPSQTPLNQRRIDARLAEIRDIASLFPRDVWIEVLDLVADDQGDAPAAWTRDGLSLTLTPARKRRTIPLPVVAEGSYELRIIAERFEGPESLFVTLSKSFNGAGFALNAYQGRYSGLHLLNGKAATENASRTPPLKIPLGQPYQLDLEVVRQDAQAAILVRIDTRPYMRWSGAASALGIEQPQYDERIEFSAGRTTFTLHSVQFKRKSGAAWHLR